MKKVKVFKVRMVVSKVDDETVIGRLAQVFSDFEFIDNNTDDMPCKNVPERPGIYEATMEFHFIDEEEWHFELHDVVDISNLKERDEQGENSRYILDKDENIYVWSDFHSRWFFNPVKMEKQMAEKDRDIKYEFEKHCQYKDEVHKMHNERREFEKKIRDLELHLKVKDIHIDIISEIHTCSCYDSKICSNEQCVFRSSCILLKEWEAEQKKKNNGQAVGTERDASDGSTPSLTVSTPLSRKCGGCGKIIEYPYLLCEECREKTHERQPWDKDGMG